MSLRIGVNLLWLVPHEVGGSGEYTIRVLEALTELAPDDLDLTLYVNSVLASDDSFALLQASHSTVIAPTSGASRAARIGLEATWLRRRLRQDGVGVLHEGGGLITAPAGCPTLLTIHDLQPLEFPENFGPAKRAFMQAMLPRSVRAATRIATLTGWVADDVTHQLGAEPDRFVRVPPGMHAPTPATADERAGVVARYGLADRRGDTRPIFLYPAITYPHKNHLLLLHAFAGVRATHPDALLVLSGGAAQQEPFLRATIDRLGIGDSVRRVGRVPWRHVEVLYQIATALTFASRYEGCGIPVLEAMVAGCPVLASDCGGLPEMAGDAGRLIGRYDIDGWTTAMRELLEDSVEREAMRERGLASAARFTWSASAAALAAAYRATAAA